MKAKLLQALISEHPHKLQVVEDISWQLRKTQHTYDFVISLKVEYPLTHLLSIRFFDMIMYWHCTHLYN